MSKKAIVEDNLPPMPGSKEEMIPQGAGDQDSRSIGSDPTSEPKDDSVSEALAGDLIALPFEAWHIIQPVAMPLSPAEKDRLAGPFSRIMEKYGLGKIAKDEILLGFYLTAVIYGRVKAVQDDKRSRQAVEVKEGS